MEERKSESVDSQYSPDELAMFDIEGDLNHDPAELWIKLPKERVRWLLALARREQAWRRQLYVLTRNAHRLICHKTQEEMEAMTVFEIHDMVRDEIRKYAKEGTKLPEDWE